MLDAGVRVFCGRERQKKKKEGKLSKIAFGPVKIRTVPTFPVTGEPRRRRKNSGRWWGRGETAAVARRWGKPVARAPFLRSSRVPPIPVARKRQTKSRSISAPRPPSPPSSYELLRAAYANHAKWPTIADARKYYYFYYIIFVLTKKIKTGQS